MTAGFYYVVFLDVPSDSNHHILFLRRQRKQRNPGGKCKSGNNSNPHFNENTQAM